MDEKEYLEQISRVNRPARNPSKLQKILSSKFFIVGAVGLVLFIIIMIIGAALGNKGDETSSLYSLKLRIDYADTAIVNYRPYLSSSELDSSSVSLEGVLATTSRDIGVYLGAVNIEKDSALNRIAQDAAAENGTMVNELSRAQTNGVLDRVYANRMTNEMTLIMNAEASLINSTKNSGLENVLRQSYESLKNLYNKFSDF